MDWNDGDIQARAISMPHTRMFKSPKSPKQIPNVIKMSRGKLWPSAHVIVSVSRGELRPSTHVSSWVSWGELRPSTYMSNMPTYLKPSSL